MKHLLLTPENKYEVLAAASAVLKEGGLVIYPTETLYGAGVDATNSQAVDKLLKFKNRPPGKAISVAVTDKQAAERLVSFNETAHSLADSFLPGPLTIVAEARPSGVDGRLLSEKNTLGIRVSSHVFVQMLTSEYGNPITATSANASGKARPYSIDIVLAGLSENQKSLIDLIVDAGELPKVEPSTVIDVTNQVQDVIRAGAHFTEIQPPFTSKGEEDTAEYAGKLLKALLKSNPEKPVVFALEGEMGAGKTRFAGGIAKALGVTKQVTSPTYNLVKEYEGEHYKLAHMDLWRLDQVAPEEIGLEEYLKPGHVLVIEWAGPLVPYFQEKAQEMLGYRILFEIINEQERVLKIGAL